tara:strand:+ start:110 stop:229 length:120 start_codon:yes stop_codon:yes gene_type:complete
VAEVEVMIEEAEVVLVDIEHHGELPQQMALVELQAVEVL